MYFKDKYDFLSNMYPCDIKINVNRNTYTFTCVESSFQSLKDLSRTKEFEGLSGYQSKKLGRKVNLRKDWEIVKVDLMRNLVKQKFSNPELSKKLLEIEGEIEETNLWHDTFWGVSYGKGKNILGLILMEVRDEIKKNGSTKFQDTFN